MDSPSDKRLIVRLGLQYRCEQPVTNANYEQILRDLVRSRSVKSDGLGFELPLTLQERALVRLAVWHYRHHLHLRFQDPRHFDVELANEFFDEGGAFERLTVLYELLTKL